MDLLLVSDTSVLIDLERADLLERVFELPFTFAVPDLLYERELAAWKGPELLTRGLVVAGLTPEGVELAQSYRRVDPRLSLPDAFALALAKKGGHTLLAGDASLRAQAVAEGVVVHGVLWLFDALHESGIIGGKKLGAALRQLSEHPRCRLPKHELQSRITKYESGS